jgi:hypothetical protein
MHRDESGRFVKSKKGYGAGDAALDTGAAAAVGAGAAVGGKKLSELAKRTPAGRSAASTLKDVVSSGKDKVSQLGRLINKSAPKGLKGLAVKGGAAGLGVGAGLAALKALMDDDDDEDEE